MLDHKIRTEISSLSINPVFPISTFLFAMKDWLKKPHQHLLITIFIAKKDYPNADLSKTDVPYSHYLGE